MPSTSIGRRGRRHREGDEAATGRSPWRRPGFIVSGVALALLAIAAVLLLVLPPADTDSAEPPPQPAASPSPAQPSEPARDAEPAAGQSTCGIEPGPQSIPATAPQAQWELVGTTAVPTDPDGAGPGVTTDDGFASCFSHDPTGALFAGINWWAQGFNGRSAQVFEELTADTPEREALLADGFDETTSGIGQVAGYRFVDVDDDRVIVDLAIRTPDGQLASLPTPMRWEDGDWKLVIPSTGDTGLSPLPDLTSYTPWSGV